MAKKYSLHHARNHFFRIRLFERISVYIEKIVLSINDQYRFFKLDKIYIWESLKEFAYLFLLCLIINCIGYSLLRSSNSINIAIVNDIFNSGTFIVERYNQYLIACLGVAGFLAGLFLSNLSGIITSRYSNIVSKVSLSVLNEYTNKKYFKSIVNYLCLIIVQLLLWCFDTPINPILSLITVLLTIKIIIIYFDLARRVFIFSNINTLTQAICRENRIIFNHLKVAVKFKKSDSVFNAYSKQLLANLDILEALQRQFIKEDDHDSLCDFVNCIMNLCVAYSELKNIIPKNSSWFSLKYEASNWFEADFSEVNIRTLTGTFINNKQVKDNYFLENFVQKIFNSSVEFLINNNNINGLYKIVNNYNSCIDVILSKCGDFEYWNKFNSEFEEILFKYDMREDEDCEAVIDTIGLIKISFILRSQEYVKNTYNDFFGKGFDVSKIIKYTNNYFLTTNEIVDIIDRLHTEKNIEKKFITPANYICEYFAICFIKNINILLEILSNNYDCICAQAQQMHEKSADISSCLLYSRILEYENKAKKTISLIKDIYDSLSQYKNNFDFDLLNDRELLEKIDKNHYINLTEYAQVFIHIDNYNFKKEKIDFCGELFYAFSEAVFETILNNDFISFELIYGIFISICFEAENFIYSNIDKNFNQRYLLSKYKIPMIMYMDLSGYIIFHSHLISDKRWQEVVENSFNKILNKINGSYDILKRLAAIASLDYSSFDMNDMKLNFSQRYSRHLRDNHLIKTKYSSNDFYARLIVDSDDDLIKEFVSINYEDYIDFYHKFYEIFIVFYVNPNLNKNDRYSENFKINNKGDEDE